jgi:hypothetical protein
VQVGPIMLSATSFDAIFMDNMSLCVQRVELAGQ